MSDVEENNFEGRVSTKPREPSLAAAPMLGVSRGQARSGGVAGSPAGARWEQPLEPQPPLDPPQETQPPLEPPQEPQPPLPQLEQEQAGTQQHTGLQQQTGTQQLEPQPPQLEPQPPEQPEQPMVLVG